MIFFLFALACNGGSGDTANGDCSSDIDGLGTDTGNLPELYGNYTTTFGTRAFYEDCEIEGLNRADMDWINGGAMQIGGRLDAPEASLASAPEAELFVAMSVDGGVNISGIYLFRGNELHISMGGLLFDNTQLNRVEIEGYAFFGVDKNGDGSIDCGLSGDFNAKRSL